MHTHMWGHIKKTSVWCNFILPVAKPHGEESMPAAIRLIELSLSFMSIITYEMTCYDNIYPLPIEVKKIFIWQRGTHDDNVVHDNTLNA